MNSLSCPRCGLSHTKRNGHTYYRKQNYRCQSCGRQFVRDSQRVGDDTRALVKRLLLERLSMRGICRVTGLSLTWLLQFIDTLYARLPDDLSVAPASPPRPVHLLRLEAEVDELWSFVRRRAERAMALAGLRQGVPSGAGLLRRRPQPRVRTALVATHPGYLPRAGHLLQ